MAGRVLLSREAREFRKHVREIVGERGLSGLRLAGDLEAEMLARPPDRRRRDIDNLIKPTLDALMHAGVVEDDQFFGFISIRRLVPVRGGSLELVIRQVRSAAEQCDLDLPKRTSLKRSRKTPSR